MNTLLICVLLLVITQVVAIVWVRRVNHQAVIDRLQANGIANHALKSQRITEEAWEKSATRLELAIHNRAIDQLNSLVNRAEQRVEMIANTLYHALAQNGMIEYEYGHYTDAEGNRYPEARLIVGMAPEMSNDELHDIEIALKHSRNTEGYDVCVLNTAYRDSDIIRSYEMTIEDLTKRNTALAAELWACMHAEWYRQGKNPMVHVARVCDDPKCDAEHSHYEYNGPRHPVYWDDIESMLKLDGIIIDN